MRNITFKGKAWADFIEWSKSDRKIFSKISLLIEETSRTPFNGIGRSFAYLNLPILLFN